MKEEETKGVISYFCQGNHENIPYSVCSEYSSNHPEGHVFIRHSLILFRSPAEDNQTYTVDPGSILIRARTLGALLVKDWAV